jgi:hypothetical protein
LRKKYPLVDFQNHSHVISELIGNKYWISNFECDSCNHLFSKREADLGNYFGVARTLNNTVGKRGIPFFESVGEGITATYVPLLNNKIGIIIRRKNLNTGIFNRDLPTGNLSFTIKKRLCATYGL